MVADDTRQADALVPKSFLTVQWSRLPHGHVPPALVGRVRKLLGLEAPSASPTLPPGAISADPVTLLPLETDEPAIGRQNDRTEAQPPPFLGRTMPVAVMSALVASLVVGLAVWKLRPAPEAEPRSIVRFAQDLPPNVVFRNTGRPVIALSPDGRSFVFNTSAGLFIRTMGDMNAHAIPGAEQALLNPVFSPDGQSVAFVSTGELRKISANGGASLRIGSTGNPHGMSWESDGSIVYGQIDGIWRAPAAGGGKPEQIIPAEAGELLTAPRRLPGGKSVLFSSNRAGAFQVEVRSLSGGERRVVVPGGHSAVYLPTTGHLLYIVESDLFGVAFDVEHLATIGNPVSLVQEVRVVSTAIVANRAISRDGTLLYLSGGIERRISVWVDRQGKEEPMKLEPDGYSSTSFSPDGTKIAMAEGSGGKRGLLVWDLAGETWTHLTLGEASGQSPMWSPDGMRIIYTSDRDGLMAKPVNNTRPPEIFVNALERQRKSQRTRTLFFTPDGRNIAFSNGDIGLSPIRSAEKPTWLLNSPQFLEVAAVLSPDGKWMAYQSNESGRYEIYVSPFPNLRG